jgi:hypothetical protein
MGMACDLPEEALFSSQTGKKCLEQCPAIVEIFLGRCTGDLTQVWQTKRPNLTISVNTWPKSTTDVCQYFFRSKTLFTQKSFDFPADQEIVLYRTSLDFGCLTVKISNVMNHKVNGLLHFLTYQDTWKGASP